MKAHLMYANKDFDVESVLPSNEQDLTQDLGLDGLHRAMAGDDPVILDAVRRALLLPLVDPDEIGYRQHVLRDCLENPSVVQEMYQIATESVESERKIWGSLFRSPSTVLHRSVEVLELFVRTLKRLRSIADENADVFHSTAFTTLFAMLDRELSDDYFAEMEDHLRQLRFRRGELLSARLGRGNRGVKHVLRKPLDRKPSLAERITFKSQPGYTFQIPERDEAGARALGELKDKGLNRVASAVAQSSEHIRDFFTMLRVELAFYVGCLSLHERLTEFGEPMCFPEPLPYGEHMFSFDELYDVCLALRVPDRVVGNDGKADGKSLVVVTGANQGGKSTFLRSIGLAQLMMQCGMFVPAEGFRAAVCDGVFSHYKREEDATMESGKLDEELARMSGIADHVTARSILLCNESFSSTNEKEGADIARQIVQAMLEAGVRVFFVTHSFDLAHGWYDRAMENTLFLRAQRQPDGTRTFKLVEGEPLSTSFGRDLYDDIFGAPTESTTPS